MDRFCRDPSIPGSLGARFHRYFLVNGLCDAWYQKQRGAQVKVC